MAKPATVPAYAPGVSVVIVSYNSATSLEACLGSVLRHMGADDEVVVVDNASQDATVDLIGKIKATDRRIGAILNRENLGFSEGCNIGIRASAKEFILLLNPDTVVTAGCLKRLCAPFADRTVGATGPISDSVAHLQQIPYHVPANLDGDFSIDTFAEFVAKRNDGQTLETKILVGFCMMLKRSILDEVGLLDPDLFLGCDDFDMSWRLQLAGYRLLIARSAYVHHAHHVSFRSEPEETTSALVQQAFDCLARKLVAHYGHGNVPTEFELWGIRDGFHPSVSLWPESTSRIPRKLAIGGAVDDALLIRWVEGDADILIDPAEPLPLGTTFQTERYGPVTLEPGMFDEIFVYHLLEHAPDVAATMTSLKDLLADWGRILIRNCHPLAPNTWTGDGFANIFGPGAFDVFCERPDLVGWDGVRFEPVKTDIVPTDYGWQLAANNGVPADQVEKLPRTVKHVDLIFEKRREGPPVLPLRAATAPAVTLEFSTYRRRALALRGIDYLLNQTIKNIELFIIGDCCPDLADLLQDRYFLAKLELARARGMRVEALNLPENHGTPHEILNVAIARAAGPYFMFAGDDDVVTVDHCASYLQAIQRANCDIVFMDSLLVGDYYSTVRIPKLEIGHVGHSELIVRTDRAKAAPPHQASLYHDWEFIGAIAQAGGVIKHVKSPPTYYVNLTSRKRLFNAA